MRFGSIVVALALCGTAQADAPKFEIKDNHLVLPAPITFVTGKATLTPESDAALAHIKAYLDDKTYVTTLRIENHTDSSGNAKFNQALTEQRALAVAKALVGKGVDCKRLLPVGFGETKPVAANDTAEHRAQNRRTEVINAALRGHPIGGMPVDGGGKIAGDPCQ